MFVTNELLNKHSYRGNFTKAQLKVFGIEWPPFQGWKFEIIDKEWPDETFERFVAAKSVLCKSTLKHNKKRRK